MDLLEKIRAEMADRNLNEVARRIGIHANSLRAYKRGTAVPAYDNLVKLAGYFRVKIDG